MDKLMKKETGGIDDIMEIGLMEMGGVMYIELMLL